MRSRDTVKVSNKQGRILSDGESAHVTMEVDEEEEEVRIDPLKAEKVFEEYKQYKKKKGKSNWRLAKMRVISHAGAVKTVVHKKAQGKKLDDAVDDVVGGGGHISSSGDEGNESVSINIQMMKPLFNHGKKKVKKIPERQVPPAKGTLKASSVEKIIKPSIK